MSIASCYLTWQPAIASLTFIGGFQHEREQRRTMALSQTLLHAHFRHQCCFGDGTINPDSRLQRLGEMFNGHCPLISLLHTGFTHVRHSTRVPWVDRSMRWRAGCRNHSKDVDEDEKSSLCCQRGLELGSSGTVRQRPCMLII